MSILEQEIIQKFQELESDAKQRVLQILTANTQTLFDYDKWWNEVEKLQTDIQSRLGDKYTVGALSLLDELREESS